MKVYCGNTNSSRSKAVYDIHHKTYDGGYYNRLVTAKHERKAARRIAKQEIINDLL
ncbi:MAG: hypothetical protein WC679_00415 [Bacteroidales bacterium]|jgi:hypothetical protein